MASSPLRRLDDLPADEHRLGRAGPGLERLCRPIVAYPVSGPARRWRWRASIARRLRPIVPSRRFGGRSVPRSVGPVFISTNSVRTGRIHPVSDKVSIHAIFCTPSTPSAISLIPSPARRPCHRICSPRRSGARFALLRPLARLVLSRHPLRELSQAPPLAFALPGASVEPAYPVVRCARRVFVHPRDSASAVTVGNASRY